MARRVGRAAAGGAHGARGAWPASRSGRGLCAQAGPIWCTMHLVQFLLSFLHSFDSVLFMSQFLDTVHRKKNSIFLKIKKKKSIKCEKIFEK